jgi:hypothetical protein
MLQADAVVGGANTVSVDACVTIHHSDHALTSVPFHGIHFPGPPVQGEGTKGEKQKKAQDKFSMGEHKEGQNTKPSIT